MRFNDTIFWRHMNHLAHDVLCAILSVLRACFERACIVESARMKALR